jgi:hypothetical protein
MNNRTKSFRFAGAALALWLLVSSCGLLNLNTTRVGETRTDTQTVELGSANEVRVQIQMGAGELAVAGDADSLMDATFRYNVAAWQPRVNYQENGSHGELLVNHQGEGVPVGGSIINEWSLLLSNAVPINLEIETGAGESILDLRDLDLTGLRINTGAGKTDVDLSGAFDHDLEATIDGGVGELSVKLPGEMGVRVSADTGIGDLSNSGLRRDGEAYVNDAYGSSPHTLFLKVNAGVGSIHLLAP